MSKSISIIATVLFVVLAMTSCNISGSYPKMTNDEAKKILSEKISQAKKLTDIFYGEGLKPNTESESKYSGGADYRPVSEDSEYKTIDELKSDTEKIFSKAYCDVIYSTAFEGYEDTSLEEQSSDDTTQEEEEITSEDDYVSDPESELTELQKSELSGKYDVLPRYREVDGELQVDINYSPYDIDTSIDIDSAVVTEQKYETAKIEVSYTSKNGNGTMIITMVYENDDWMIDSPIY